MGIRGLTTFVEENPNLLQDCRLHDTKVVIDGNNLYHQLYYHYHVGYQYNGDYDQFSTKTQHFFSLLKSCNISPVIVFDGGYETDDRKLHTILERARSRLHLAGFISHGDRGKILPILAYETFRHILIELGIPHVTCDFEADSEIIVLANDLKCPVISMDSDFYIFEIVGGYIPFNSINLAVQTFKESSSENIIKYLPVKMYFTKNLVEKFPNLDQSILPLIATLLGNDLINVDLLEEFYSKLKVPKIPFSDFFIPKGRTKMIGILNWLKQVENIDQATERILSSVRPQKRNALKIVLEKSIANFSGQKSYSSFNLFDFITGKDHTLLDEKFCMLFDYDGLVLPESFCLAHRRAQIPVFMLNATLLHRSILLSQVEDMQDSSSFQCAMKLRQIIYGIIVKGSKIYDQTQAPSKKTQVEEYDREIKNIKKSFILPMTEVAGYGHLPGLRELSILDEERFSLLCVSLEVNSLLTIPFPDNLKLIGGTIMFWIRNANPHISKNHLKALLVCILILNVRRYLHSDDTDDNNCITDVIQKSSIKQLEMVENSLKKYFVQQEHSKKNVVDIKIVHAFAQFQACAITAIHLNQLLSCPLLSPNPAQFFNGTFLYNFCRDLNTRSQVDLFISEMLVKSSPLLELYNLLLSCILENVEENYFLEVQVQGNKRSKKQRKSKQENKNTPKSSGDISNSDSDDFEKKHSKDTIQAACSLTNRFQFLDLEDSD